MKKSKAIISLVLSAVMLMPFVTPSAACADLVFNTTAVSSIGDALMVPKGKLSANAATINEFKKDEKVMAEVEGYFAKHQTIDVVDFAGGNALVDNNGNPAVKDGEFERTGKFKFFPELGVITPVFSILAQLKEKHGWTGADMQEAMEDASSNEGSKYRIPVKLTEDAQIYAYMCSKAKESKIEDEFSALTKD